MKFIPSVNAEIRSAWPPTEPTEELANRAIATAPKIGIVIPETPDVDCRKIPIRRYATTAAITNAHSGTDVRAFWIQ